MSMFDIMKQQCLIIPNNKKNHKLQWTSQLLTNILYFGMFRMYLKLLPSCATCTWYQFFSQSENSNIEDLLESQGNAQLKFFSPHWKKL